MKKLTFQTDINATAEKVVAVMTGAETYKLWTSVFNPTSDFEGSWNKGEKIYFISGDENGKKGGMVAEIKEHIPNEFISIHHYGFLDGENEITEGPEFENWGDALENYSFKENNGITTVTIEMDTSDEYKDYFSEVWPKALQKLKELVEQ